MQIYKIFYLILLTSIFVGCSTSSVMQVKNNQKVFEDEDKYIFLALRAEQLKDSKRAAKLFNILYKQSNKKEYLYRSLSNLIISKEYGKVVQIVNENNIKSDDLFLKRIEIIALINLFRIQEAEVKALALVKQTKKVDDYLLVSDIYIYQKKFNKAVKYLESAYIKDYNEKILDKISRILYLNLGRKKEAIAQLETHSRIYSCSKLICTRLISFYSNENDINGLLSAYLRYYKIDKSKEVSEKIIQIYSYQKEYIKLIDFLKENKIDDFMLLDLYVKIKNYKKAFVLAENLYEQTGDIEYLGKSAIYEYQDKKDNLNSINISNISKKFEKVIVQKNTSLYLNYYGYLLIDHDIDVDKGIKYINRALQIKPNATFYLDSLAWGYYKQNRCKKAKIVMDKVVTLDGGDNEEILSHIKLIDKCLKK